MKKILKKLGSFAACYAAGLVLGMVFASVANTAKAYGQPPAAIKPHSEQGRAHPTTGSGRRMDASNPMHPLHWLWVQGRVSNHPRFGDDVPPDGEPGDIGGGDPVNPCPNGDC